MTRCYNLRRTNETYGYLRRRTEELFAQNPRLKYPFFPTDVVLNGEGLHHLRYSAQRERTKPEQMLKFRLMPFAPDVVHKSGMIQEYRKISVSCLHATGRGRWRKSSTGA